MERCPYAGCGHLGNFISKAHCKVHHGMTREQLTKKYGPIRTLSRWQISINPSRKGEKNEAK